MVGSSPGLRHQCYISARIQVVSEIHLVQFFFNFSIENTHIFLTKETQCYKKKNLYPLSYSASKENQTIRNLKLTQNNNTILV